MAKEGRHLKKIKLTVLLHPVLQFYSSAPPPPLVLLTDLSIRSQEQSYETRQFCKHACFGPEEGLIFREFKPRFEILHFLAASTEIIQSMFAKPPAFSG